MDRSTLSDSYTLNVNVIFSILFNDDENAPLNVLISTLEDVSTNLVKFAI